MKEFLFTISLTFACWNGPLNAQVVGGHPQTADLDFFCSLVYTDSTNISPACGASLIAPQWVLTAGHCGLNPQTLSQLDSIDVVVHPYIRSNTGYERIRSSHIFTHASIDLVNSMDYDIALIRLRTPVQTPSAINLPLQGNNDHSEHNDTTFVVGFGVYDINNTMVQPDTLQLAEIKVIHNDTCNLPSIYSNSLSPGMLCAGRLTGTPIGAGSGDSGGPLFADSNGIRTQVGIVSWGGNQFSTATQPGVFTRVASYRTWIDSVVNSFPVSVNVVQEKKPTISINHRSVVISFPTDLASNTEYVIYDISGQTVKKGQLQKSNTRYNVDATALRPGLYAIRLFNTAGLHIVYKVFFP